MPSDQAGGISGASQDFARRYGLWALVAGASEGVGAAFARAVAARGVNVVLLARRQPALEEVAADIAAGTGAQTRTLAVDLTAEDAVATVSHATADLEVGTMMYCAGADPVYQPFLANPVEVPLALVQRNCVVSLQLCHHFAGPMVERGRGAIVIVSSGAALAGAPNMVAYGASKAFDIVMAEALWSEIKPRGVDVLALVLGATDTPALRRLLASRGVLADPDDPTPIPDTVTAEETAAEAVANLSNGPTWFVGDQLRAASEYLRTVSRNEAVNLMIQGKGGLMDNDRDVDVAP